MKKTYPKKGYVINVYLVILLYQIFVEFEDKSTDKLKFKKSTRYKSTSKSNQHSS